MTDATANLWVSNMHRAGIPARFQLSSFSSFRAETREQRRALTVCTRYAEQFEALATSGASLLLCGGVGTGKTHLACSIAKAVLSEAGPEADPHRVVRYMTTMQAIRHIREAYRRDSKQTESQAIAQLVKPKLLVLDELGVQRGTQEEQLNLFDVLDGRYSQMRSTVLVSNLELGELSELLGQRVIDRLLEGKGVALGFNWPSHRTSHLKLPATPEA